MWVFILKMDQKYHGSSIPRLTQVSLIEPPNLAVPRVVWFSNSLEITFLLENHLSSKLFDELRHTDCETGTKALMEAEALK